MNPLQQTLSQSTLKESVRDDLILLVPELSQIEQLRVKKALELNAYQLLTLLPIKYKSKIQDLKAALLDSAKKLEETQQAIVSEVDTPAPESLHSVKHTSFSFDEFSWSKLVEQIEQQRPNDISVSSLLKSSSYLGGNVSRINNDISAVPYLEAIDTVTDVRQIAQLDALHVSFLIDENPDQKLLLFKEKISQALGAATPLTEKRAYFLLFLRSPLFFKYTFTGLTALNLKTDLPRKTLLNVLHQNDERFLNLSQFEWTAKLVRIIRSVVII
jgi:hypothetical protein